MGVGERRTAGGSQAQTRSRRGDVMGWAGRSRCVRQRARVWKNCRRKRSDGRVPGRWNGGMVVGLRGSQEPHCALTAAAGTSADEDDVTTLMCRCRPRHSLSLLAALDWSEPLNQWLNCCQAQAQAWSAAESHAVPSLAPAQAQSCCCGCGVARVWTVFLRPLC